jgi:hypothetical protein
MMGGQPPAQAPNTAPNGGGSAAQLPQQALSQEQIRQLQIMSKQAMGLLLEDATAEQIVAQARAGDASQVIAGIVVPLMQRLHEAASGAGQNVEMVTLMVTGLQIIGTLTEMLVEAGVVPEAEAQQFVAQTSKLAVDQHNQQVQQQGGGQPGAQGAPQ